MELTRGIDKATKNNDAQLHAHRPVGVQTFSSTAFASPFSTRP